MTQPKITPRSLWMLICASVLGLLISCDGTSVNGGIGGTGKTPTIEDDGLILGKVGGFGSIVINDQRFDTQNAEFIVDGKEAYITDLQIGMNVGARVNFTTKLASKVFYQPLVAGPIESTEAMQSTLTILGQSILITPETVLDGLTPDALQPDLVIEVSGTRDSNHAIVADYITLAATDSPNYTVGVINRVNREDNTALLSGTLIDYLPATIEAHGNTSRSNTASPLDQLKPGNRVRVEVSAHTQHTEPTATNTNNPAPPKTASKLTVGDIQSVKQFDYNQGSRVEVTGRINMSGSDGAFIVSGVTVYIDVATQVYSKFGVLIENPMLRDNEGVSVEGKALGARRITAHKITLTDRL